MMKPVFSAARWPRQRALALVLVLWIVAALSLFAASLAAVLRGEALLAGVGNRLVQGRALGEAAIYQVLQRMAVQPRDFDQRQTVSVEVGDRTIDVLVVPASGLININQAPQPLLELLLEHAAEVPRAQAAELAQAIVQAREGAGGDITRRRQRQIWESPQDLLQVPGMTWGIYTRVRDFVVANTEGGSINPEAAAPELLQWLQAAPAGAQYLQKRGSQSHTLLAQVPFDGAGTALILRQTSLIGGARTRLPWVITAAAQHWRTQDAERND